MSRRAVKAHRPPPAPHPPPGWVPPHARPPADLLPRPTVGPPPPLRVGSWVVADVVPPIAAEFTWAPPDLRLGRVTEGPIYKRGPQGFIVEELWRVDSLADLTKRYRLLKVKIGGLTTLARRVEGDVGKLVFSDAETVADVVLIARAGRLAEAYLADPRVQSEESAAIAGPARELAAACAAVVERFAAAARFRRRDLGNLLAGLRDAALAAAAVQRAEAAAELTRVQAEIDALYWTFTRTSTGKPPAAVRPDLYTRRAELEALLRRFTLLPRSPTSSAG